MVIVEYKYLTFQCLLICKCFLSVFTTLATLCFHAENLICLSPIEVGLKEHGELFANAVKAKLDEAFK